MKLTVRLWATLGGMMAMVAMVVAVLPNVATAAAAPSAQQALKLRPIQKDVDIDRPTAEAVAKCKIAARKMAGHVGWVVEDPAGLILRRFVDTDGNNVVDQWSYYKNGVEVYRDIDTDHNGKVDQCRWFHTAGSRWGLVKNQDGKINTWKVISAEEVSAEVAAALALGDADRFARLVLTPEELESLGLGPQKAKALTEKIDGLGERFKTSIAAQKPLSADAKWVQFSGTRPGIVPAGTDDSTKDLRVYENVVAIVQSGDKHIQVQVGTLVQVGDAWRAIDLPEVVAEGQSNLAASGFFFRGSTVTQSGPAAGGPSQESEKLLAELEQLDRAAAEATTPKQRAEFVTRRIELVEQIAEEAASPQDRALWLRQLADMISAEVQSGTCPDGSRRLQALFEKLKASDADKHLAPYVKFRQLTAEYFLSLQAPDRKYDTIQEQWLKNLKQYVTDYPASPDTAEAMLQLAIAHEFAAEEDEAKQWYGRVAKSFPNSTAARKAVGARTRLDSIGKTIAVAGKSSTGSAIDLAKYRGRVVLIQYWATWSEPAKADMAVLKELMSKYGRSFSIIGVSLDSSRKDLIAFLGENKLPWPQIFEEGGLDSPPANQLGILTLPTMILVDKQGKVVDRNIQTAELDGALKKLIR